MKSQTISDSTIQNLGIMSTEFHYLCGPMSNIPGFNIPRFLTVAEKLRAKGVNLISPAEMAKNVKHRERYLASDGTDPDLVTTGKQGQDELRDDLLVVVNPNCVGLICLEGWAASRGAKAETYVAEALGLPLFGYLDDGPSFTLVQFNREDALCGDEIRSIRESNTWSLNAHRRRFKINKREGD